MDRAPRLREQTLAASRWAARTVRRARIAGFTLIGVSASPGDDHTTDPAGTVRASCDTVVRRDALSGGGSQMAVIRLGVQLRPGTGSDQLGLAA